MRALLLQFSALLLICGCREDWNSLPDGWVQISSLGELGCSLPKDMGDMAPPAKCAAAKGLSGDNLLCVDFSSISDQTLMNPLPQALTGWDFSLGGGSCPGWAVSAGKLQVKNFSTFMSSCGFLMPALSSSDYQKYSGFTLSVVQRLSIDESATQKAQVMLGADDPLNRLMTQWTGKEARQQSMISMNKADLPSGSTGYQPLFKFSATTTASGSYTGWQIESIAINASP